MDHVIRPSVVAYRDIDFSWMVGRKVASVTFHEPVLWHIIIGSDATIGVGCLWRIIEQNRIVLTSEDHLQKFGLPAPIDAAERATEFLSRITIQSVQLHEATADLVLDFTSEIRVEILPNSSGYESWQLRDPNGTSYVAQGGGQICVWQS
ncbi:MAG: DUF6188 family protein [Pirellulales bacterium]